MSRLFHPNRHKHHTHTHTHQPTLPQFYTCRIVCVCVCVCLWALKTGAHACKRYTTIHNNTTQTVAAWRRVCLVWQSGNGEWRGAVVVVVKRGIHMVISGAHTDGTRTESACIESALYTGLAGLEPVLGCYAKRMGAFVCVCVYVHMWLLKYIYIYTPTCAHASYLSACFWTGAYRK